MDQRAHDVEEDLKSILQTRLALGDKIQTLERHVEATVESTKMAALDALDMARNRAASFIESTTNHLNPTVQAGRRPWIMVGSAIAIGFFAGLLEQRRRAGIYRYYPSTAHAADVMPESGRSREPKGVYPFYGREHPRPPTATSLRWSADESDEKETPRSQTALKDAWKPLQSLWDELAHEVSQERDRLQHAALHAGRSFIHDIVRLAGQSLVDRLSRSIGPGVSSQAYRRAPYE
ncbi:MAG TPA: hypothetical protein VL261_09225 [Nitrospira sp.]|jgi:ElaB/YqjD/DUF883 family membrane-anchored ribosome-binding protein|nr:hypothetical protein [Nitrospira sp.]